ncbi:MAG: biosynthetic arginine decarboxylase [Campylobacteraceae bacterium]|nr:biosynthetic arginine decarboxylase [Campylobacteraceae bacterium]
MINYGIDVWGQESFIIEDGCVKVNYGNKPSLVDIVREIRENGHKGPVLLRFPHLIEKQIDLIYDKFNSAFNEFGYQGKFNAVFPLKVNQFPNFVRQVVKLGKPYGYGLEAGSKAEIIIAMAYNNDNAPITVNGFKDMEMISLCFIAAKMGHNITITIEGINELELIIEVAKRLGDPVPNIGLRMRLHSVGMGMWAKSGGINSKFGLTSTELIEAMDMLKSASLLEKFNMIHFHIGSQMGDIAPLKKALREAGNIYAELKKSGAVNLNAINLGGGIAVEYSQQAKKMDRNYKLEEFANDVVYLMKGIAAAKGVNEPDIYTESGRFIAASHAVLVAPVLELFSNEYESKELRLKPQNPPLVEELLDLLESMNDKNAGEYMHDAIDHMESLLTLFDLGYVDLQDRSNTEILLHLITKKFISLSGGSYLKEIKTLQDTLQEKYLLNFSIFQSVPDHWGLGQNFPIMPIHKLDEKPTRSANIWDITCDSDGEITFNIKNPLFLHDVDLQSEDYFVAFFKVGAYQEVLGMQHNLFTHPTEATVEFDESGGYEIKDIIQAQNLIDILDDMDYDIKEIEIRLRHKIADSRLISEEKKKEIMGELYVYLSENNYLRTVQF